MRRIYLVRHGKPDFPDDGRWCLGRTDTALGTLGKLQAVMLGKEAEGWNIEKIFCSPLSRARQTAEPVLVSLRGAAGFGITVLEDLTELDAGIWDGHSFEEIRARWPELYEKRVDPTVLIPGQEPYEDAQKRFLRGLYAAVDNSTGNIAIVAHTTVFCLALCALTGRPWHELRSFSLPYGSYTVLEQEEPGAPLTVRPEDIGLLPHPALDGDLCMRLLFTSDLTTDAIVRHCKAVRDEAMRVAGAVNAALSAKSSGSGGSAIRGMLDLRLVESGALLHDVARLGSSHEALGAKLMEELGYPEVASVIRQHKEPDSTEVNEAGIVCMADKCRKGELPVSVEQRFYLKMFCNEDPAAEEAAKRRYALACELRQNINGLCGSELVKIGSFSDGPA